MKLIGGPDKQGDSVDLHHQGRRFQLVSCEKAHASVLGICRKEGMLVCVPQILLSTALPSV